MIIPPVSPDTTAPLLRTLTLGITCGEAGEETRAAASSPGRGAGGRTAMRARSPARAYKEVAAVAVGLTIGFGLAATISTGIVPVPWADPAAPAEASQERVDQQAPEAEDRRPTSERGPASHAVPDADGREPASPAVPEPSPAASAETGQAEELVPTAPGSGEPATARTAPVPSPTEIPATTAAPQAPAPPGTEASSSPQDAGGGKARTGAPRASEVGGTTQTVSPTPTEPRASTGAQRPEGDGDEDHQPSLLLFRWLAG